ncbi:hypothetical protein TNCV_91551 [Trichonephila clavipes]|nr:hypothetical protein TNCV_91551 [Trichonephila clavipes]
MITVKTWKFASASNYYDYPSLEHENPAASENEYEYALHDDSLEAESHEEDSIIQTENERSLKNVEQDQKGEDYALSKDNEKTIPQGNHDYSNRNGNDMPRNQEYSSRNVNDMLSGNQKYSNRNGNDMSSGNQEYSKENYYNPPSEYNDNLEKNEYGVSVENHEYSNSNKDSAPNIFQNIYNENTRSSRNREHLNSEGRDVSNYNEQLNNSGSVLSNEHEFLIGSGQDASNGHDHFKRYGNDIPHKHQEYFNANGYAAFNRLENFEENRQAFSNVYQEYSGNGQGISKVHQEIFSKNGQEHSKENEHVVSNMHQDYFKENGHIILNIQDFNVNGHTALNVYHDDFNKNAPSISIAHQDEFNKNRPSISIAHENFFNINGYSFSNVQLAHLNGHLTSQDNHEKSNGKRNSLPYDSQGYSNGKSQSSNYKEQLNVSEHVASKEQEYLNGNEHAVSNKQQEYSNVNKDYKLNENYENVNLEYSKRNGSFVMNEYHTYSYGSGQAEINENYQQLNQNQNIMPIKIQEDSNNNRHSASAVYDEHLNENMHIVSTESPERAKYQINVINKHPSLLRKIEYFDPDENHEYLKSSEHSDSNEFYAYLNGNRVLSDRNSPDVSNRNHESLDRNPPDKSNENNDNSDRNPSKVSNGNQVYLNENEHSMQLRYFERLTKNEHVVSNGNHELLKENRETVPKVPKNLNISESSVKNEYLKENTYSQFKESQKYLKINENEETFRNHNKVNGNLKIYENKLANSYKGCSNESGHTVSNSFNEYLKKIGNASQRGDDENFRRHDYSAPGVNQITLKTNSHSTLNGKEEHLQGNQNIVFSKSHEYLIKDIHTIADENQMYLNKHATMLNKGNENLNKNEYSTNLDDFKTYQKTNEQLFNEKTYIAQKYGKSTSASRTTGKDLMTIEHYPFLQGNHEYLNRKEEMDGLEKSEHSSFGTESNNLKPSSSFKTEAYVNYTSMVKTSSRNLKRIHSEKIERSSRKTVKNINEYTTIPRKEGKAFKTRSVGEFSKSYVTGAYEKHLSVLDTRSNLESTEELPIDNIHQKKTSKPVPFVISRSNSFGTQSSTILQLSTESTTTTNQAVPVKSYTSNQDDGLADVNKNNNKIIFIPHIIEENEHNKNESMYKIRASTEDLRQTYSATPDKMYNLRKEQLNLKDNSMVADDNEPTEYYSHKNSIAEAYEEKTTFRRKSKSFKKQNILLSDNKEHMKEFQNKTAANDMNNQKKIEHPIIIDKNYSMERNQDTHVKSSNTEGYGNSKMISGIIKENLSRMEPTLLSGGNKNQNPDDVGQNNEFRIKHQHYYSVVNSVTPETRKAKTETPYTYTKPKNIEQKFTLQYKNSIFRLRYPDNEKYFSYADRKDSLPSGSSINYQQTTTSIFPTILGIQNTKNEERDSQHLRKDDTSFTSPKPLKAPSVHRFIKTSPVNRRISTSFQPTNSLINPFVYRKKFIPDDLDFDKHTENYEISTSTQLPTKIPIGTTMSVLTIGNKEYIGSELHYNKLSVTPNPPKISFDYQKIATLPEVYKIYEKEFHSLKPDRYRNNVNDLLHSNNKKSLPAGSSNNYLKTTTSVFPLILKSESAKNEERDSQHLRKDDTSFTSPKPLKAPSVHRFIKTSPVNIRIPTSFQPTNSLINPFVYRKKFIPDDLDFDKHTENYEISTSTQLPTKIPIGTTMSVLTIGNKEYIDSELHYNKLSVTPNPPKISFDYQKIATLPEVYKIYEKEFHSLKPDRYRNNVNDLLDSNKKESLPAGFSNNYLKTTTSVFPLILKSESAKNEERDSQHLRKDDTSFTSPKPLKAPSVHRFIKTSPVNIRIPTSFQPTNSLINPFVYRKKFLPDDLDFDKHSENYEISTSTQLPTKIPIGTTMSVLTIGNKEYTGSELHYNKLSVTPNPPKISFDYQKIATSPEVYKIYEKEFHSLKPDLYRNNVNDLLDSNKKESLPSGFSNNHLKTTTSVFPLVLTSESAKNEERDYKHFRKIETPFTASKPFKTSIFNRLTKPKTEKISTFYQPTTSLINPYFYRRKSYLEEDLDFDEYNEDFKISVKELVSNKPIGTPMSALTVRNKKYTSSELQYNKLSVTPNPPKVSFDYQKIATSPEVYKIHGKGFHSLNPDLYRNNVSNLLYSNNKESLPSGSSNNYLKTTTSVFPLILTSESAKNEERDYKHFRKIETPFTASKPFKTSIFYRLTKPKTEKIPTFYQPTTSLINPYFYRRKSYLEEDLDFDKYNEDFKISVKELASNKPTGTPMSALTVRNKYTSSELQYNKLSVTPNPPKVSFDYQKIATSPEVYKIHGKGFHSLNPNLYRNNVSNLLYSNNKESLTSCSSDNYIKTTTSVFPFILKPESAKNEERYSNHFRKIETPFIASKPLKATIFYRLEKPKTENIHTFSQPTTSLINPYFYRKKSFLEEDLDYDQYSEDYEISTSIQGSMKELVSNKPIGTTMPFLTIGNRKSPGSKLYYNTVSIIPKPTKISLYAQRIVTSNEAYKNKDKAFPSPILDNNKSITTAEEAKTLFSKNPVSSNILRPMNTEYSVSRQQQNMLVKHNAQTSTPTIINRVKKIDSTDSRWQHYSLLKYIKTSIQNISTSPMTRKTSHVNLLTSLQPHNVPPIETKTSIHIPSVSTSVQEFKRKNYFSNILNTSPPTSSWQQKISLNKTRFPTEPSLTPMTIHEGKKMYHFAYSPIPPTKTETTVYNVPIPTSMVYYRVKDMDLFPSRQQYDTKMHQTQVETFSPVATTRKMRTTDYSFFNQQHNTPVEHKQKSSFQSKYFTPNFIQNKKHTYNSALSHMLSQETIPVDYKGPISTSVTPHRIVNISPFPYSQQNNDNMHQTKAVVQTDLFFPSETKQRMKNSDFLASILRLESDLKHIRTGFLNGSSSTQKSTETNKNPYNFRSNSISPKETKTMFYTSYPTLPVIPRVEGMDNFPSSQQQYKKLHQRKIASRVALFSPSSITVRKKTTDYSAYIWQQESEAEQDGTGFLNGPSSIQGTESDNNIYNFVSSRISPKEIKATIDNGPIPTSAIIHEIRNMDPFSVSQHYNARLYQTEATIQNEPLSPPEIMLRKKITDYPSSGWQRNLPEENTQKSSFQSKFSSTGSVQNEKTYSFVSSDMPTQKKQTTVNSELTPTSAVIHGVRNMDTFLVSHQHNGKLYQTETIAQNTSLAPPAIILGKKTTDYPVSSWQPNIPKHTHKSSFHSKFSTRSIQKDNFVSSDMSTQKTQITVNSERTPMSTIIHGVRNMDTFAVSQQHNGKLYQRATTVQNTLYSPSTPTKRMRMSDILAFIQQQNLSLEQIKAIFLNGQSTFPKTTERDKNTYYFTSSSISPKKTATIYNTPIPTSTIIYSNTNVDPFSSSPESNKKPHQSKTVAQNGLFLTSRTTPKTKSLDFLASSRQQESELEQKRTSIFNRPSYTQETTEPAKTTYSSVSNHISPKKIKAAFYNGLTPISAINFRLKNTDHFPSTEQSNLKLHETKAGAQSAPFSLSAIMLKKETSDYPAYSRQSIFSTIRQRMNRDFLSSVKQKERDEKQTGTVSFRRSSTTPMTIHSRMNTNNFAFNHTVPQKTITMVSYGPFLNSTIIDGVEYAFMCKSNNASKFDSHPLMYRSRYVHPSFFEHKSQPESTKYISMPYTSTVLPHIQRPKLKLLTEKQQEIRQSDSYVCGYVRVGDSSQTFGHTPELLDMNTQSSVFSKSAKDYHIQFFEVSPRNERKLDMATNILSFTIYGRDNLKAFKISSDKPYSIDNSLTDKNLGITIPYHSLLNYPNLSTPTPVTSKPINTENSPPNQYLKSTSKSNLFRLHIYEENNQNSDLSQQKHTLPNSSSFTPFTFNSLNDDVHIHRTSTNFPFQSYIDEKQLDNRKVTQLFQSLQRNISRPYTDNAVSYKTGFDHKFLLNIPQYPQSHIYAINYPRDKGTSRRDSKNSISIKYKGTTIGTHEENQSLINAHLGSFPEFKENSQYFDLTSRPVTPDGQIKKIPLYTAKDLTTDNLLTTSPIQVSVGDEHNYRELNQNTDPQNKFTQEYQHKYSKLNSVEPESLKSKHYTSYTSTVPNYSKQEFNSQFTNLMSGLLYRNNVKFFPYSNGKESLPSGFSDNYLKTTTSVLPFVLRIENSKNEEKDSKYFRKIKTPFIASRPLKTPIFHRLAKPCPKTERVPTYFQPTASLINPFVYRKKSFLEEELVFDNYTENNATPTSVQRSTKILAPNAPIGTTRSDLTKMNKESPTFKLLYKKLSIASKPTKLSLYDQQIATSTEIYKFKENELHSPIPGNYKSITTEEAPKALFSNNPVLSNILRANNKEYSISRQQQNMQEKGLKANIHNAQTSTPIIISRTKKIDPLNSSWQHYRPFKHLTAVIHNVPISASTSAQRTNDVYSLTSMQPHDVPLKKTKIPINTPSISTTIDEFKSRNFFNNAQIANPPAFSLHHKILLDQTEASFHSEPSVTPRTIYGEEKTYNFERSHVVPKEPKRILHNVRIPTSPIYKRIPEAGTDPLVPSWQRPRLFKPLNARIPKVNISTSTFTSRTNEMNYFTLMQPHNAPLLKTKAPLHALSFSTTVQPLNTDFSTSTQQQQVTVGAIRTGFFNGLPTPEMTHKFKNTFNFVSNRAYPQQRKTTAFSGSIPTLAIAYRIMQNDSFASNQQRNNRLNQTKTVVQNDSFLNSATTKRMRNSDFLATRPHQKREPAGIRTYFFNAPSTPKTILGYKNTFSFAFNRIPPQKTKATLYNELIPTPAITYRITGVNPFPASQKGNTRLHHSKAYVQNRQIPFSTTVQETENEDFVSSSLLHNILLQQKKTVYDYLPLYTSTASYRATNILVSNKPYNRPPKRLNLDVYDKPTSSQYIIFETKKRNPLAFSQQPHVPSNIRMIPFPYQLNTVPPNLITYPRKIINEDGSVSYLPFQNNVTSVEQYTKKPTERKYAVGYKASEHKSRLESARNGAVNISDYVLSERNVVLPLPILFRSRNSGDNPLSKELNNLTTKRPATLRTSNRARRPNRLKIPRRKSVGMFIRKATINVPMFALEALNKDGHQKDFSEMIKEFENRRQRPGRYRRYKRKI